MILSELKMIQNENNELFDPLIIGTKLSSVAFNRIEEVLNFNSLPIPTIELYKDINVHEVLFRANLSKKLTWHKYTAFLDRTITRIVENSENQKIVIYLPTNSMLASIVICTIKKITNFFPILLIYAKSNEIDSEQKHELYLVDLNGIEISLD